MSPTLLVPRSYGSCQIQPHAVKPSLRSCPVSEHEFSPNKSFGEREWKSNVVKWTSWRSAHGWCPCGKGVSGGWMHNIQKSMCNSSNNLESIYRTCSFKQSSDSSTHLLRLDSEVPALFFFALSISLIFKWPSSDQYYLNLLPSEYYAKYHSSKSIQIMSSSVTCEKLILSLDYKRWVTVNVVGVFLLLKVTAFDWLGDNKDQIIFSMDRKDKIFSTDRAH